jgi:hypothetical protein
MRIACWLPKTTNIHSEYVILIAAHIHNVCTKAPQYYSTRILPNLLHFQTLIDNQRVLNFPIRSAVYRFFEI